MSSKKNLASVTADLSKLAIQHPSQHVEAAPARVHQEAAEEVLQFSLSLRKSLRKQLARLADDNDMTMRAYVLLALKEKGLSVTTADLADLRKQKPQLPLPFARQKAK